MRERQQLELTVGQYDEAKRAERQRLLAQLLKLTAEARDRGEAWYVWVAKRRAGEHDHELRRADGSPAACPVYGCHAVRGKRSRV